MFVFSIPIEICEAVSIDFDPEEAKEGSQASKDIKSAVRQMIISAIDRGFVPESIRRTERGYRLRLPLPANYTRMITKWANDLGANESQVCETIIDAAIAQGSLTAVTKVSEDSQFLKYLNALKLSKRPAQLLFFEYLTSISNGEIGLVEASTGVGKSLGILSAACKAIEEHKSSSVIAVPSKALIVQFRSLYQDLEKKMKLPPLQVILGRNNFVALSRLNEELNKEENIFGDTADAVKQWVKELGDDAGLIEDLAEISSYASAFSLGSHDKDDPSEKHYKLQFDNGDHASIILTTHAMVASHLLKLKLLESGIEGISEIKAEYRETLSELFNELENYQKHSDEYNQVLDQINELRQSHGQVLIDTLKDQIGVLPNFKTMYVDEAHLFDESMNLIFSSTISFAECLRTLYKLVAEKKATKSAYDRANSAYIELQNLAGDKVDERSYLFAGSENRVAENLLLDFANACLQGIKPLAKKNDPLALNLINNCNLLKRAKNSVVKYKRQAFLEYSPIAKFPRVCLRQKSLEREYSLLWGRLDKCALVSATLYNRQIDGDSSLHIRKKMFIPTESALEFTPIRPAWLTASVSECLVPAENRSDLIPPGRRDKLTDIKMQKKEREYLTVVASELTQFLKDSVGGTLVLCTSYRIVEALSELIEIDREVISAQKNVSVTKQKERFCKSSLQGGRPVWLALGGAWTGLDINGSEFGLSPKDDNLLTDLAIIKIPFVNIEQNSLSPGYAALEASLKFKQGLGRLVRREGLPKNRRIIILDARLSSPDLAAFTSTIRHMLSGYRTKKY